MLLTLRVARKGDQTHASAEKWDKTFWIHPSIMLCGGSSHITFVGWMQSVSSFSQTLDNAQTYLDTWLHPQI